ncbi:hypothetical protein BKK54_03170 [Rodentibacter genomosp. 1]|uniref:HNH nuclease domain-containing protein n=1 Tax=Rodentibacter genomosp. 1 TaxID=1908264 RepID=A0A1V3J7S9_9PAST|nr:HNH endonuclease signature motif containing protein [Rodentibacter genomosp. 1]OOF51426.1 hypothetical protein BKK54_03170 [Rodentibacter genomosp. 1]
MTDRFKFTEEHIEFIRLHWDKKPSDLIKLFKQKFGLTKHRTVFRKLKKRLGIPSLQHANRYTKAELDFIKENRQLPRCELAKQMSVKFGKSYNSRALQILCTKRAWKSGRNGRFQKGDNFVPIGTERLCAFRKIWLVKTGIKSYEAKHLYIWRKYHGEIPKGYVIWFKDGDTSNCTLENLEMITRTEMLWRHRLEYNSLADELKPSFDTFIKLRMRVAECKKKK